MAYTTIDKPSDYFETVLYAGNAGTQSITSLDFQPDWVWCKERGTVDDGSGNDSHAVFDSVRGATKRLIPNGTNAEGTQSNGITAFNSNGFTSGDANITNGGSSRTYASWNWKAGGSASSNSDGSITSSVSASTDAGFSIVKYTGTGSATTVGHGLNAIPKMIIVKGLTNTTSQNWRVFHNSTSNGRLVLNDTVAAANSTDFGANGSGGTITQNLNYFNIGTDARVNGSGQDYIAYCFAEKQGYSKFSSYVGNGNADGTFVYTGFKPAWLMVKSTAVNNWNMLDNKRSPFNLMNQPMYADLSQGQESSDRFDFTSNGIKMRTSNTAVNGSGQEYIIMAFAENPFVTSTGVPATAR